MTTLSPARAHKARLAAKQAAHKARLAAKQAAEQAKKAQNDQEPTGEHNLMLVSLDQQRRSLKSVQSMETKKAMKAEYLKEWQPYIDQTLAENSGAHDGIISRLWVWLLDTGDIEGAINVGRYLLEHELPPPQGFVRDTATTFAEEIADMWLKKQSEITAAQLDEVLELTADHDTLDEVRAKLQRAVGEAFADSDPEKALAHLQRAVELNDKVGCKKQLDALKKQLKQDS